MRRIRVGLVVSLLVLSSVLKTIEGQAQTVIVKIGSATGSPGDVVNVAVSLETGGRTVVATQNDIVFDPHILIASTPGGRPDCRVNPDIDKIAAAGFQPLQCTPGLDCSSAQVIIFTVNVDPIPDGSELYTCTIRLAADLPLGTYPLHNADVRASDPKGAALPATGTDGGVRVVPRPTVTLTVKPTASPTLTATPSPTVSPTPTPTPVCTGDCDGNHAVTVDELVIGVDIALESMPLDRCPSFDRDHDSHVTVDELVTAVNEALTMCEG
ncbi:MAG: hypothetical protein HYR72_05475 [Deltaproteobacteria bacterium]|nr:hypothetical protein [Deltaproteobacteria bacterium]MBI3389660.1 hypothetical protein [Deltaproteobacteria bacterium]